MSPPRQGQPEVKSEASWRFIAPLGPIEAEELRWYLEKYRHLAKRIFPGPRAQSRGEPCEMGKASARSGAARCAHGERYEGLGADRRSCRPPFFGLRRCGARSRRARNRGGDRPRSRHAPARPPLGTCCTTATASFSRVRSPRASVGVCRIRACSTCRWSPCPSVSCWSPPGRRTKPAATSITARVRCRWSRRLRNSAAACSINVLSPPTLPALREELDRARRCQRALSRRPLRWPRRL